MSTIRYSCYTAFMIIVLSKDIKDSQKNSIRNFLESKGFKVREIVGEEETIFGAVGIHPIDRREVEILDGVKRVIPISKPYKLASRELKKSDTVIDLGPVKIGGQRIALVAGPCAVESKEQIEEIAFKVREAGGIMLRGGAFKPRTSPYSFQGLGEEGLKLLKTAGEKYGLPVVSEIVAPDQAGMMNEYLDVIQVGARNMQNFELLKKVGALGKPVLLKRGLAATIEEWLMAAEYVLAHGTDDVILCERGIRTFETYTRNTLDLSAIPVVKKLSHLPVIVDPSHATGIRAKVPPMALAAVAAGADGLVVEVHHDPPKALSDGPQSLYPEQFEKLVRDIEVMAPMLGKEVERLPEFKKTGQVLPRKGKKSEERKGERVRIAFQGENGAYSEAALRRYFDETEVLPVPCETFGEVFKSVLVRTNEYGIIPVENSLAGSIHENYDLLLQYPDIEIVGEQKIRIEHALIGLPGAKMSDISRVYSHPQGLAQCAEFLRGYPEWEQIPFYDTAGAVGFIGTRQDPGFGAIASEQAAEVYGMQVLRQGIETNPRNYTRFVIIAATGREKCENPNKASIVFSLQNKPGALYLMLKLVAEKDLNLTKLESRPILGKPWEYMFYADVEIPSHREYFNDAVAEMQKEAASFRILGTYRI